MKTKTAEMTDVNTVTTDFSSSARAGRRNAVSEIQGISATDETSALPPKLETLSLKEDGEAKDKEKTQEKMEKPPNEKK